MRSGVGIGCTHASTRIVIPPVPNNTIRNMSNPLSLIVYSLPDVLMLIFPSGGFLVEYVPSITMLEPF